MDWKQSYHLRYGVHQPIETGHVGLQVCCIKPLYVMIWSYFALYGPRDLPKMVCISRLKPDKLDSKFVVSLNPLYVMIWSYFAWYGPWDLPKIFRKTTQNLYYDIYIFIEKISCSVN